MRGFARNAKWRRREALIHLCVLLLFVMMREFGEGASRCVRRGVSSDCVTRAFFVSSLCAIILATGCGKRPGGQKLAAACVRTEQGPPDREEIMGIPMGDSMRSVIVHFCNIEMRLEDAPHIGIPAKEGGYYFLFFQNPIECRDSAMDRLLLIGAAFLGPGDAAPVLVLPKEQLGNVVTVAELHQLFPVCARSVEQR